MSQGPNGQGPLQNSSQEFLYPVFTLSSRHVYTWIPEIPLHYSATASFSINRDFVSDEKTVRGYTIKQLVGNEAAANELPHLQSAED